jgi:hypothetical protein
MGKEDMNAEQLKKNIGQAVRLRPHVLVDVRLHPLQLEVNVLTSGEPVLQYRTQQTDYEWTITDIGRNGVTLHCSFTGHTVTLGADNIRDYRTPGFLMLKCQLTLDGDEVRIEPI